MGHELTEGSLTQQLLKSLRPRSEDDLYKAHFNDNIWGLDTFSALMSGIAPERAKELKKNLESGSPLELKRLLEVTNITRKFLKCFEEISMTENPSLIQGDFYMSAWRFIKWIAMNDMPLKTRFFEALPIFLLEIYLEFRDENITLRTKPQRSQAYHRALYLKNAKELVSKAPYRLSRDEIYADFHMQNVLRQIRALGGHYKERTIKDAWLAKLEERKKGRPKKGIPVNQ